MEEAVLGLSPFMNAYVMRANGASTKTGGNQVLLQPSSTFTAMEITYTVETADTIPYNTFAQKILFFCVSQWLPHRSNAYFIQ